MKKIILIPIILLNSIIFTKAGCDTVSKSKNNPIYSELSDISTNNKVLFNKINVGGNIGFGFSNNYSYINFQPRVSYQLLKWIIPGISFTYQYSRQKYSNYDLKYNTWGPGLFAYIYPVKFAYAHIEYQHLWYNQINTSPAGVRLKDSNDYLLLGAGVRIPVSSNMYLNASILFNVLDDKYNIYQNPIYSVGFGLAL